MSGLVLELQRDALDNNVDVSNLLRKAIVVSKKLGVTEIEEWIKQELSGYQVSEDSLPKYREVHGAMKVFNPYHGLQPLHMQDAELAESLSRRGISQSIGELVSIVNSSNSGKGSLQIPYPQHIKNQLMNLMRVPLEPILIVGKSQIHKILDSVRNEVLNWALELEAKGVVGDGMSFSNNEKNVASQVTYQITNNIGNMENSQLQQDSSGAHQTQNITQTDTNVAEFIAQLKEAYVELQLDKDQQAELEADVSTIESQLTSPKPKPVIIAESLKSTRSILEGITGSVLATGLLSQLAGLL